MELASNLVWVVTALLVLGTTVWGIRRGTVRLSVVSALTLACLICMLLLPAISISDDLMQSRQAALPAAAQSWRLAWEDASVGLELAPLLYACFFLLAFLVLQSQALEKCDWDVRRHSAWLTRAQRLRPPPTHTY